MTGSDRYWPAALLAGSIITLALFSVLPSMRFSQVVVDEPAIVIDFTQWREPQPLARADKPVIAQRKPTPKPKVQQHVEPVPTREKQAPPVAAKKPVIASDPQPLVRPDSVPQPVPPPPVPRPLEQKADNQAPQKSAQEQPSITAPLFKLTSLPRFSHKVQPEYPPAMRALGREATVKLEVLIDRKGRVRKVTVLKSAGKAFDEAASKALLSSNFVPGNIEGIPVAVRMRIPVRFSLR